MLRGENKRTGKRKKGNLNKTCPVLLLALCIFLSACGGGGADDRGITIDRTSHDEIQISEEIPEFSGEPYITVNEGESDFDEKYFTAEAFESYSPLDELGRCGTAFANIGRELMPDEERESIGQLKPSGWQTIRYDIVDGQYLYNRCHLIGFQLTGENANEKNLLTGTRYMNIDGMLPFEDRTADYIRETGNHVLYRVTPVYEGSDLLAKGVLMEACSVEDEGRGIEFNVFVYNSQPGIIIDYATGESRLAEENSSTKEQEISGTYILNTNSKKFHYPDCYSAEDMDEHNREEYNGTPAELAEKGYEPCGRCRP